MTEREDFSPDWPHGWTTRGGRAFEPLTMNGRGGRPIVGYIEGDSSPTTWLPNGQFTVRNASRYDLINAPAPKRRVKGTLYGFEQPNGQMFPCYLRRDGEPRPVYQLPEGCAPFAIPIDHEIEE